MSGRSSPHVAPPDTRHPGTSARSWPVTSSPFSVPPDEAVVAASRRRIVDVVRGWEVPLPEEVFDDLALLASEVVTNAVRHTRAACAVTVRWTGERVRVEVTDTDPARPALREVSADAEDGRGLLLGATRSRRM